MAVPPRVPKPELLTHLPINVSATLRSMSHVVVCFSFALTAMAQLPENQPEISAPLKTGARVLWYTYHLDDWSRHWIEYYIATLDEF